MTNEDDTELRNSILSNNKMLYCMRNKPADVTCMCWGLAVPDAWLNEIDWLSRNLEALNYVIYPRFKVRILVDQVKSKYGTLRYYYSIIADPPFGIRMCEKLSDIIIALLNKFDYQCKRVYDVEPHEYFKVEKLTKDEYDALVSSNKLTCVEFFIDSNGNYMKKTRFYTQGRSHLEATHHKFLYAILKKKYWIRGLARRLSRWEASYKLTSIITWLTQLVESLVKRTTDACSHRCEICGSYIDESLQCVTIPWVSYLCEKCAKDSNLMYLLKGEMWCKGEKKLNDKA